MQNLASIAWSFSAISFRHQPFLEAIASAALATGEFLNGNGFGGSNIQSLLWPLWKMERHDLAQRVYEHWSSNHKVPCVLELGLLAMESAWRKEQQAEPHLLMKLMKSVPVRLMRIVLWKVAMVPDFMRLAEAPAMPPCDVLGLTEQECRRYLKLARFVQYLECTERGGSPEDIVAATECFPSDVGRWLQVAAGDKAVILWDALKRRRRSAYEVAVEFGALVGYTAIRLGAVCAAGEREHPARAHCADVVTCELDTCHACIARHAIDLAGLSATTEVWIGQVRDLLPRLVEEFGGLSLGYVFMDQKGTAFHEDLQQLELLGLLAAGGCVLADNCLKPGAPFFVWHVSMTGTYNTTIWTMSEFLREEIEDWMVVCHYTGMLSGRPPACPPDVHAQLVQLAWEIDNIRAGPERGAVHIDDCVAFSQYVLRYFARLGIEATPWPGLPQPEEGYPDDMPLSNDRLAERFERETRADIGDMVEDE